MLSLEWQQELANADLKHYRRIYLSLFLGETKQTLTHLLLTFSRTMAAGKLHQGRCHLACLGLQPLRGTSARLFDSCLAGAGCGVLRSPMGTNYPTQGKKPSLTVKLSGQAERVGWCGSCLEGNERRAAKIVKVWSRLKLCSFLKPILRNKTLLCNVSHFYLQVLLLMALGILT